MNYEFADYGGLLYVCVCSDHFLFACWACFSEKITLEMGDNPYLKSGVSSCFSSYMISGKFSFGTLPDSDLTLGALPKKYCRPSAYLAYYCSIKAKLANF